jgi:hypothetical protein
MSTAVIIASWPKNARETLMVKLDTFKDQPIVDCRAWYTAGDGSLKPGRSGLTVSIRHLPALADAIAKALTTATTSGHIAGIDSQNH